MSQQAVALALSVSFGFSISASSAAASEPVACASLKALALPETTIVTAEEIAGPTFTPPGATVPLTGLPAFCRVAAVIDPQIRFEVWLPLRNWNGKFQGTGNGGYAGNLVYTALAAGLRRDYATANTDEGHQASVPHWAVGQPELIVNFAYRSQHETALKAKAITRAFYGKRLRYAYFTGCSEGGRDGMLEAQMFPGDYDGIVAGAPAFNLVHLHSASLHGYFEVIKITPAKLPLISKAVLDHCDATDGVTDGVLNDPRGCDWQAANLACSSGQDESTCLIPAEMTALENIYRGQRFSNGKQVYPGWTQSSEVGWSAWRTFFPAIASITFGDIVYQDRSWDFNTFNVDRDVPFADATYGVIANQYDPDLRAFQQRGAKLILYHGWVDQLISPLSTVRYYENVVALLQGSKSRHAALAKVQEFARLFMAPGMQHCGGGPGPNSFDFLTELENWVERGKAPDRVIAAHLTDGEVDRTRPLCVYPKVAVYSGRGDTDDAASFVCRSPHASGKRGHAH